MFKNGIGRFDFPTSSSTDTRNSIKKIKEIKDDYEIYPGHGELTTLIQEKLNNPYLRRITIYSTFFITFFSLSNSR